MFNESAIFNFMKSIISTFILLLIFSCLNNLAFCQVTYLDSLQSKNNTYSLLDETKENLNKLLVSKQNDKKSIALCNQVFDSQVQKLKAQHIEAFLFIFNAKEQLFVKAFVNKGYHKYLIKKEIEIGKESEKYIEDFNDSINNEEFFKLEKFLSECEQQVMSYYDKEVTPSIIEVVIKNNIKI